ncbi:LOW QUALITY PROTEIN: hypothetical protein PHMEG_0007057 [Phytophthora megakarya]|uniref:Uncharacterized protein n=1 Tax=Phytophthora megakarya TaxID=4795 RepID=A0A225WPA7_9STRA|nr:LOW QUALITY PROTEIN: hypothetical protein PHMEG_0007057 [Phytophthora megakarya]
MATPIIHVCPTATRSPQGTDALSTSNRHTINATTCPSQTVARQHRCQCLEDEHESLPTEAPPFRRAPSDPELRLYTSKAKLREATIRLHNIKRALQAVGLELPLVSSTGTMGSPPSTNPFRPSWPNSYGAHTFHYQYLSSSSQTSDDYRPNKNMIPDVLSTVCQGYKHLPCLLEIAKAGNPPTTINQACIPSICRDRYNVLVKNIRKEQNAWLCIVVEDDILRIWSEVHVSPFGVVGKGDGGPQTTCRVIHDLSFPVDISLNDFTNSDAICELNFEHCDAIATAITDQHQRHPTPTLRNKSVM